MQITINTAEPLSDQDRHVLSVLAGTNHAAPQKIEEQAKPKAESKPAAAPKAESKPAAAPKADDTAAPSLEDAVAAATKLVSDGKAAKVKAALADVGAKRVSELSVEDIPSFLSALDA